MIDTCMKKVRYTVDRWIKEATPMDLLAAAGLSEGLVDVLINFSECSSAAFSGDAGGHRAAIEVLKKARGVEDDE